MSIAYNALHCSYEKENRNDLLTCKHTLCQRLSAPSYQSGELFCLKWLSKAHEARHITADGHFKTNLLTF